jgi:2-keto-4-pentenoate hydratase/2-oxohepta-3-ene-1,7-dioic acid hydratase in catechol pathway
VAHGVLIYTFFSDHIKELNNARPKQPFFFLKPPSSIIIPNSGPILRPKGVSLHYEVELGLVIGKTIRDFDEADEQGAIDAIESKTCFTIRLRSSRNSGKEPKEQISTNS